MISEREERRKKQFPVRLLLGHIMNNYMTVILKIRQMGRYQGFIMQEVETVPQVIRIFKPTVKSAFLYQT